MRLSVLKVCRLYCNLQVCKLYCSVQSNHLPHPHPHYFCANLDKLRDPYFQKVGRYVPPDASVAPSVASAAFNTYNRETDDQRCSLLPRGHLSSRRHCRRHDPQCQTSDLVMLVSITVPGRPNVVLSSSREYGAVNSSPLTVDDDVCRQIRG